MEEIFLFMNPKSVIDNVSRILANNNCKVGVKLQAIYILVNIAAIKGEMRDLIIDNDGILSSVVSNIESDNQELTLASLWLFINISWDIHENSERKAHLLNYKIIEKVEGLYNCEIPEIRDRVKTLVKNFN